MRRPASGSSQTADPVPAGTNLTSKRISFWFFTVHTFRLTTPSGLRYLPIVHRGYRGRNGSSQ